ncbi:enoyl-CoA hydratase/isomerase family protein [Nocardia sp. CDC160]|uniref:enoyl-CoA hydratase/isomerase family protein n=1 Tax=Nocardia sp. CDC160 TaxID=3112166 RepID=UPI002DC02F0E|nr:enoyl-CoA hydratase/isomerase family protein [Nocardia sp. CDC160]MEC3915485.1 enoyl-CoA hydratase/isomerase family protein [Nocardia sp. CDC160]
MTAVRTDERQDGVVLVTIDRPHRRNALDPQTVAELHTVFADIAGRPEIRAVVITGAGSAFSAGADLKSTPEDFDRTEATPTAALLGAATSELARTMAAQELMASLFERIHRLRQPVIAAVNGAAVGGGFALTLACDIRIACPEATFGAVFIRHGVSACDMGTSYHLPRLVGASRAAELMLTGRVFDAEEALRIGLTVDTVPATNLIDTALAKAAEIAAHSPLAVWMTKETLWQNVDAPSLRHALDLENRTQVMCTATGDLHASFAAFRDHSTSRWKPL